MFSQLKENLLHPRANLSPRSSDFDSNYYYRFFNTLQPNKTISSGLGQSANGTLKMTTMTSYSASENWQLYYQSGRYFIRNYDYEGSYQLGLTADSRTEPKLIARSGALGQQWSVVKSSDGTGFLLTNGLLGNGSYLSLSGTNLVPAMSPSTSGAVWDIQVNPSAGNPKDTKMYQDNADFEIATTSISSASSTATSSSSATVTALPSGTQSPSSVSSTPTSASIPDASSPALVNAKSSSGLGIPAIVGIAVGGVAGLAIIGLIIFFILRKRRRTGETRLPSATGTAFEAPANEKVVYARRGDEAELADQSMVFEAQQKGYGDPRYELDGQSRHEYFGKR